MREMHKALVRRYRDEFFNLGRFDIADELFPNVLIHHGDETTVQEMVGIAHAWRTAIPDIKFTIQTVVSEGDYVAEYTHTTGMHEGELFGIPATGKYVDITLAHFYRFEGGKIVEISGMIDRYAFYHQLGILAMTD
mgnify:CR=1 FL=1